MHALVRQKLVYTKTRVKEAAGGLRTCAVATAVQSVIGREAGGERGTVGGQE
jgi:hypothetical protein